MCSSILTVTSIRYIRIAICFTLQLCFLWCHTCCYILYSWRFIKIQLPRVMVSRVDHDQPNTYTYYSKLLSLTLVVEKFYVCNSSHVGFHTVIVRHKDFVKLNIKLNCSIIQIPIHTVTFIAKVLQCSDDFLSCLQC